MKKTIMLLSIFLLIGVSVHAGIKDRMAERLPVINKLKAALLIGEGNKAYLVLKGTVSAADQKVIDAENADREKIYKMLAKKTKVTVEKMQSRRAEQIAKKSKKGIWLQKTDGTWYKK
jgi:uncharacterized protein